jgi:hypothetical protein
MVVGEVGDLEGFGAVHRGLVEARGRKIFIHLARFFLRV